MLAFKAQSLAWKPKMAGIARTHAAHPCLDIVVLPCEHTQGIQFTSATMAGEKAHTGAVHVFFGARCG